VIRDLHDLADALLPFALPAIVACFVVVSGDVAYRVVTDKGPVRPVHCQPCAPCPCDPCQGGDCRPGK
jgi:hypothetical protein